MGLLEWTIVDTPDSIPSLTKEILNPNNQGSGINKIVVANDGNTFWAIVRRGNRNGTFQGGAQVMLYRSIDGGLSWSDTQYANLAAAQSATANGTFIWDIATSHDDPNIVAVVCADITVSPLAQEVWISMDKGGSWENTHWPPNGVLQGTDLISTIDISRDFNGRKIIVGTRDGTGLGTNNVQIMRLSDYGVWNTQDAMGTPASVNPIIGDILAARFSPNFASDFTIVVLYTDGTGGHKGTYLAIGMHDIAKNTTTWQPTESHVEIKNPTNNEGDSPRVNEIITASIALPSDFSGQSSSLRRFYISTDAVDRVENVTPNRGIYRVDDNTIYTLMDNTATFGLVNSNKLTRRAASIAYWGTCTLGKLLVGEVLGHGCRAAVTTWFTDSPTVCPVPCWYPTKKPSSGAAGQIVCNDSTLGYGNAQVAWSPIYARQGIAYVATGSASLGPWDIPNIVAGAITPAAAWPAGYINIVPFDESAFGLTRNNGETWNQLSLTNTLISKLTDVAPSADGSTIYLASTNNNTGCQGFNSVWRSSINEKVVAPPLPALPIGQVWERVRVSPTALKCEDKQSSYAILRLAPDKLDGQVVGWAAGGTSGLSTIGNFAVGANTTAMAWSPDFGDYWADIIPRIKVQDFAFESSTILHVLSLDGNVQKMPYTGIAWSGALPNATTNLGGGHTIEAKAADNVLVGNKAGATTPFPAAISIDGGRSFVPMIRPIPEGAQFGYHAIFDTDYGMGNNTIIYLGSDATPAGHIHRNSALSGANVDWTDMCTNYIMHHRFYGLNQTNSKNVSGQGTLYAAHAIERHDDLHWCSVERTINSLNGMPIPGLEWNSLNTANLFRNQDKIIEFTLEPKSLKICGCLTQDSDTTLWAIDNACYASNHNVATGYGGATKLRDRGMLWVYTDCVAKKGPKLTMDDGITIGCDPLTGRNYEVDFTWEQLCIATHYQIQIAKDKEFTLGVTDTGVFMPFSPAAPSLVYLTGGGATSPRTVEVPNLELGHTYYWRCRARAVGTGENTVSIISPWSEIRSFNIKASPPIPIHLQSTEPTKIEKPKHDYFHGGKYDFFIAHAWEDKDFVGPLARILSHYNYFKVWYDDFELKLGDSLRRKIDLGLSRSRYGIVVLSHNFFNKNYPQKELDGLVAKERLGKKVILPIWHNITREEVESYSPTLADIVAVKSNIGYQAIVNKIIQAISSEDDVH